MHHFNSTACQTKGHWPERTLGVHGKGGRRGDRVFCLLEVHVIILRYDPEIITWTLPLPPSSSPFLPPPSSPNTHTYLPCPIHNFIQLGDHKFCSMVQFSSRSWCGGRGDICLLAAIRHQVVWAGGDRKESPGWTAVQ